MNAYANGVIAPGHVAIEDLMEFCMDYVKTVNANIQMFLKDKSDWMIFYLRSPVVYFRAFWDYIEAQGDLRAALSEWDIKHNKKKGVTNNG